MQVGIIGGTGPLGRGLGLRLADAGAQVVIGSRDESRAAQIVDAMPDHWADRTFDLTGAGNDAAAACETVVVATPWDAALATVKPLAPALDGKVVVSVANALIKAGREMHALIPARGSMAAELQAALPGSFVAAAGHHLPASELENLGYQLNYDVLVCADHEEATNTAMSLVGSIDGLRPLDAGSLASAAAVEAFTAVLITLNIRYKGHSSLQLSGLDHAGWDKG